MDTSSFPTLASSAPAQPDGSVPAPPAAPAQSPYMLNGPVANWIRGNPWTSALAVGGAGVVSGAINTVGAFTRALGMPNVANTIEAHAGNPIAPPSLAAIQQRGWTQGGIGGALEKVGTTALEAAPYLAAARIFGPEEGAVAVPGFVGRLSGFLPRFLGGTASNRAALAIAGMTVPSSIGGIEQENAARPGGPTQAGAVQAVAAGVPVGAVQALAPAGILERAGGGMLSRVVTSMIGGAAANAVGAGLQTAAELSERPDVSIGDKMRTIVSSAADSAAAGGLLGGAFGIRRGTQPTTQDLSAYTDEVLSGQTPGNAMPDKTPAAPGVVAGEGAPAAEPAPAGPNPVAEQIAQGAGVKISEVPMLENLQSRTMPEAYNEIANHPELANHPTVANSLGIGRDLDAEIAQHVTANPEAVNGGPGSAQLQELGRLADLRTQAQAVKPAAPVQSDQPVASQIARAAGAPVGDKSKGVFADFVRASQAKSLPELYNEAQDAIAAQAPVTGTKSFDKVVQHLEGQPDVVEQAQALRAAPQTVEGAPEAPQTVEGAPEAQPVPPSEDVARAAQEVPPAGDTQPTSIADRVVNVARELVGDKGGNVAVDAIRKALPDVAPADLDNAMRQIHADDTGAELVKADRGDRNGRDGVTLGDQGKFHFLSLEPQGGQNAAGEPSAAGVDVVHPPANGGAVGGGNSAGNAAPEETPPRQIGEGAPEVVAAVHPQDVGASINELDLTQQPGDIPRFLGGTPTPPAPEPAVAPTTPRLLTKPAEPLTGARLPPDAVNRHVANFVGNLRPEVANRVHLVDSAAQLPPDVLTAAADQGVNIHALRGLYHNGEVYINRSLQQNRADLEDTLSHEVFGHLATGLSLGGQPGVPAYDAAVADIFDRAGGYAGIKKIAQQYGVWDGTRVGGVGVKGYLPAEGFRMNAQDKADAVEELIAHASATSSTMGPMKRAVLAIAGSFKQGIAARLREGGLTNFAKKFEGFGASDMAKWMQDTRAALQAPERPTILGSVPGQPQRAVMAKMIPSQLADTQRLFEQVVTPLYQRLQTGVSEFARDTSGRANPERLLNTHAQRKATQVMNGFRSLYGLARAFPEIPALRDGFNLSQLSSAMRIRAGSAGMKVAQSLEDLHQKFPKVAAVVQDMMRLTELHMDVEKPWSAHSHLFGEPNAPELKAALDAAQVNWNKLGQPLGKAPAGIGQRIYRDATATMRSVWFAEKAAALHDFVQRVLPNEGIPGFAQEPLRVYNGLNALHGDIHATEAFWRGQYQAKMAGVRQYIQNAAAMTAAKTPTTRTTDGRVTDLTSLVQDIQRSAVQSAQGQYFHLGRQGDYFVALHLRPDPKAQMAATAAGTKAALSSLPPDAKAVSELQTRMGKYMNDVSINSLSKQRQVFMRFRSPNDAAAMKRIADGMHDDGFLEKPPISGAVDKKEGFNEIAPAYFDRLLAVAKTEAQNSFGVDPLLDAAKQKYINDMRGVLMDVLPSTSWRQTMMQRKEVQGFDPDMFQNFASRVAMHANALSTMATSREFSEIGERGRTQVDALQTGPSGKAISAQDALSEYFKHQSAVASRVPHNLVDALLATSHSYQLGFSTSFMAMQAAQPMLMSWPALSKKFGAVRSAKELAAVMPDVAKVFRAMASNKSLEITPDVLAKSGISGAKQDMLMKLVNWGVLELSNTFGQGQSYSRGSRGLLTGRYSKMLNMANSTATASEIFGRLQTALAAHNLWEKNPSRATGFNGDKVEYARWALNTGMLSWGSYDTPRLMGQQGFLGAATPLVTKFHQFQSKYTELLFHEIHNAFTANGVDAKESQRFLMAHLAATIVLGGALGLPTVGFMAAAATQLSKLWDGQAYDVEAHFHQFMENLFGKEFGKILTSGLPRELGVDGADWGAPEMPFQKFLEDRRAFADKWSDDLAEAAGAPVSMVVNSATGAVDIANGQVIRGMARMLPKSMRGLVNAYRMVNGKYVNQAGVPLPLSASASDILTTAVGLTPGKYAEYEEKNRSALGLSEERTTRKDYIQLQLAQALEHKNPAGMKAAFAKAQAFNADPLNKGMPALSDFLQFEKGRMDKAAHAQALGIPLGTNVRDQAARQLTNW